jgi:hypothetical protein
MKNEIPGGISFFDVVLQGFLKAIERKIDDIDDKYIDKGTI